MNKLDAKKKVIRAVFGLSLPTWINTAIGIIAVPLVTRLFEPDVLGKFNLFNTYGTILYCIALAGLNQGLMRFYHEPPGRNTTGGLYKLCQAIVTIMTFIIIVVIFTFGKSFSNIIAGEYNFYVILCLVFYIAAAAFLNVISSLYRMQDSILAYGIITVLMNLCSKITYAGAALIDDKFIGMITLLTGSYVIIAVIYMIRDFIHYREQRAIFGKEEIIPLLKYSFPLMPVLFISQINTALPKLIIAGYLDYFQVGIYTSAYSIVSIISIVQSGINIFWAPFVFKNYVKHPNYLSSGHTLITFVMTIFGLIVLLFQDAIYLFIGSAYQASQQFFALLLFSPICYTISETTGIGINISKKTYLNFIVYGVTIVITFALCFLLIPMLGLHGAAIAVAGAAFSMLIVKTIIGEKFYKIIVSPIKSSFAPVLFLIVVALNTLFFHAFWFRTILTLLAIVIICLIYHKEMVSLIEMVTSMYNKQTVIRRVKN